LNAARQPGSKSGLVRFAESEIPTDHGTFRVIVYRCATSEEEHVGIVRGEIAGRTSVLCRVHSECFTGETLGSLRCDCRAQLDAAFAEIEKEEAGVIVYLRQEGRGIGLGNKIRAYALQDQGVDTVDANHQLGFPADARRYDAAATILRDLGVRSVRLMTNNPDKVRGLASAGVPVDGRLPIRVEPTETNAAYLKTKRDRLGHLL
jgi:3,4-dihydroxy 2-butanone 4-phosphate synthase/GTP cyclohydrolase II